MANLNLDNITDAEGVTEVTVNDLLEMMEAQQEEKEDKK